MSENKKPTPAQAYNLLVQLSQLPILKLSLSEHQSIQVALEILKPLVPQEVFDAV